MLWILIKAGILSGLWLLLSGKYDYFHLSLGAISVTWVMWMTRHIRISEGDEARLVHINWAHVLFYPFWLLGKIIKSNFQVAYVVLHPKVPIDPALVRFTTPLSTRLAKATLGNSITLTPGTVTLDIQNNDFVVHALDHPFIDSLAVGEMQRRVARLFGDPSEKPQLFRGENAFPPPSTEGDKEL